jgi:hypothetical protein
MKKKVNAVAEMRLMFGWRVCEYIYVFAKGSTLSIINDSGILSTR